MPSGVKWFDGYDPATNTLIDAKNFTNWPKTSFQPSMNVVRDELLDESRIAAQNGSNLEIRVATQEKADILQRMAQNNNLGNVRIVYWPAH